MSEASSGHDRARSGGKQTGRPTGAGGAACAIGCAVKAPSTLGTYLRSFPWGMLINDN